MKNITLLIILLAFCINATAKDNNPKLADVRSLAGIDKISYVSPINKKMEKFGTESILAPVSLKKSIAERNATTPKKFNFSIMPYAWFASVGGTVGEFDGEKYGFNKGFTFKGLHMYAAFIGKIKYERVSFVFDISYVNYKNFGATTQNPNLPQELSANTTAKQALYDLFLAYLFPSKSKKTMVDIYGGGRFVNLDLEATVDSVGTVKPNKTYSNSWLSPVIGVNAEFVLDSKAKWAAWTKGDIGGFGVNHSMTWQMNVGVAYMISPNFPLTLGFKYVGFNYYKNKFNWTVNEYGPTLGIGYRY
ncbi:MAG TPA: hypothetical protein PKC91_01360 [Ignavibacteria bacterium]|nr:hypothetical protein [Ignavibacteria bacterium]